MNEELNLAFTLEQNLRIRTEETVEAIEPHAEHENFIVRTARHEYTAARLLVATGTAARPQIEGVGGERPQQLKNHGQQGGKTARNDNQ